MRCNIHGRELEKLFISNLIHEMVIFPIIKTVAIKLNDGSENMSFLFLPFFIFDRNNAPEETERMRYDFHSPIGFLVLVLSIWL